MICLAFEFTSDRRSVAVADNDTVLAEIVHSSERRTPVFALVERALHEARQTRESVRRIAVSIGPGSYTGIRIAISAAQGWHLGINVDVVGVNTFEVLRVAAQERELPLPATFAIDAQRNEYAVRTCTEAGWDDSMKLEGRDAILQRITEGQSVLGPELGNRFQDLSKTAVARPGSTELFPTASIVARLAGTLEPIPPEALAPVYLREAAFVKAPPARVIAGITD